MRPRTYWLIVLSLLVALLGQCAGTNTSPHREPTASAVTVAAGGCQVQGATP